MNPEATNTEVPEQKIIKSSPSHLVILFLVILAVAVFSALGTYYYLLPQLQYNQKFNIYPLQSPDESNTQMDNKNDFINGDIKGAEDWKTYTDSVYGFNVKYPSTWIVESNTFKPAPKVTNGITQRSSADPYINFSYLDGNLETVKLEREKGTETFYKTQIGGRDAYTSKTLQGFEGGIKEVLIDIKNGKTLLISAQNVSDILDTFLSTFKFINQTQSTDTSTWKTYTNAQTGYEIKYPSDWKSPFTSELSAPWWTAGISKDNDNYCYVEVFTQGGQEIPGTTSPIAIDGVQGHKISSSSIQGITEAVYIKNLRISMYQGSGNMLKAQCNDTFDQILSTFKFTN